MPRLPALSLESSELSDVQRIDLENTMANTDEADLKNIYVAHQLAESVMPHRNRQQAQGTPVPYS